MKTLLDWEPYKPFTVGFDTIMDRLLEIDTAIPNYPPYNIRKTDELEYVIDLAVAGFGKDDIIVDDIKAEVFSDVESYVSPPPTITQDYDEILEDDDGYPD